MSLALSDTAATLGCSERTLRRYVNDGLLRGRRITPFGAEISAEEETYLKNHWTLLKTLKGVLRTERNVRLAVLFGSSATGDDQPGSDVDVLVAHSHPGQRELAGLSLRLHGRLTKPVHVIGLEQAQLSNSLLADILLEGRPLIDRDGLWQALRAEHDEILLRAAQEEEASATSARETVAAVRARSR